MPKRETRWTCEKATAEEINTKHINSRFLPERPLPPSVHAAGREFIILASPSLYRLDTVKQIATVPSIREGECLMGIITKGFLNGPKGPRLIRLVQ